MQFMVKMTVSLPADLDEATRTDLVNQEREYSQNLQRSGKFVHLWRIVGEHANYSLFDVESNAELHEILTGLPMFPYMTYEITALTDHPNAVHPRCTPTE